MNSIKMLKVFISILAMGNTFQGVSQYLKSDYTSEQILKAKVKEVYHSDSSYTIVDSFGNNGRLVKTSYYNSSNTKMETRHYIYSGENLIKVDYYKNFTKIKKKYSDSDTLTEFEGLRKSGEDFCFYDTLKNGIRLKRVVGYDWGRYVPNKEASLLINYIYISDSVPGQFWQVKSILHNKYIYDSQDTLSTIYSFVNFGGNVIEEKIENKNGGLISRTYNSFGKINNLLTSSVTYLAESNTPDIETNYVYDRKGLKVSTVQNIKNQCQKLIYSFSNY